MWTAKTLASGIPGKGKGLTVNKLILFQALVLGQNLMANPDGAIPRSPFSSPCLIWNDSRLFRRLTKLKVHSSRYMS